MGLPPLRSAWAAVALALAAGCESGGGPPADVRGTYTVNLTNDANGCELDNWTVGQTTRGVTIVLDQDGGSFTADVTEPISRGFLDLVVGGHVFVGTVSGSSLVGTLDGTRPWSVGTCDFEYVVTFEATLVRDTLEGRLVWRVDTDGSVDCGTLETCQNVQRFNGTRPPSL